MKITGKHVVLRDEKKENDSDDFFHWRNLGEWQYYDEPDETFESISREKYEQQRKERNQKTKPPILNSHTWQIDTLKGQHVGWVNYYQLDEQLGQAFVGICLPEEGTWNKGYGTEALNLLINYLFREIGLKKVKTATWTGNKRMVRCAEKCGFEKYILMPHRVEHSVRGEPLERIEFTLTCSEWLSRKTRE
ncbi:MAG: GNAT family N-acetyltransferase [Chloroflexota bacterium]